MNLTEPQRWLLEDFAVSGIAGWVRPMDLGGRDGSNHSAVLRQLERKGYVESKQRLGNGSNPARGSRRYRLTDEGLAEGRRWARARREAADTL